MKRRYIQQFVYWTLGLCIILMQGACVKEGFTETTDETPNIATFLKNSTDYTLFYEAIKKAGTASYLDAWGTYTVFAPNNAAMGTYMGSLGKSTVADLSDEEVKLLVNQHIVTDTISTSNFRDGKITKNAVGGMFITTSVRNVDGHSEILLNKESVIILPNQRTGNGWVHGVDKVFTPITRTVMEEVLANAQLSLFAEALQATGLDVLLNSVQTDQYYSVLAISNTVFAQRGIQSLDDLKERYQNTSNPKNPTDSLYMHMAYHIVPELKYVSDLMLQSSHTTKVNNEIILVKVDRERVLINEEEWLGNIELGAEVDRGISDNTARNGVLHYLKDNIYIKQRFPFPVYWDPADQPEIRMAGVYKRLGLRTYNGFFKDIKWEGSGWVDYSIGGGSSAGSVNGDYLSFQLRTNTATVTSIEFKTPVIVRGRYRVWLSFRTIQNSNGSGNLMDIYFNNNKLSRQLNQAEYRNTTLAARELEALGYKRVTASSSSNVHNCKMLGIVDVDVTDRQTLKLVGLGNGNASSFLLDMVHFIPVDMEQIYPMFDVNGEAVYP